MWMALCAGAAGQQPLRDIFLYDTFDGMTFSGSEKDAPEAQRIYRQIANKEYRRSYDTWHKEGKWAYAPLELVKENMASTGYPAEKVHYVQGDVLETLGEGGPPPPDTIAILRLDTDWYESTKRELEVLFPRVAVGGYIIVDDYYTWKGSRVATDEFLEKHQNSVQILDKGSVGNVFGMRRRAL